MVYSHLVGVVCKTRWLLPVPGASSNAGRFRDQLCVSDAIQSHYCFAYVDLVTGAKKPHGASLLSSSTEAEGGRAKGK
jgi:hypothetical protein